MNSGAHACRCTCTFSSNEGLHTGEAYATAVVLLIVVFAINALVGNHSEARLTKGK